jgi:hypothetical protein
MEPFLHGDPAAAGPYWHEQTQPEDCAEMSVADVVGQLTGHEPTESDVTTVAQDTASQVNVDPSTGQPMPVLGPNGTAAMDIPQLLADYGVSGQYVGYEDTATAMSTIQSALDNGDKVIAYVDAPEIWNAIGTPNNVPDTGADHFVVVTGIDTANGIVYLNDSGSQTGEDEAVPISVFEQSLAQGHNSLVIAHPEPASTQPSTSPDPSQLSAWPSAAAQWPSTAQGIGGQELASPSDASAAAHAAGSSWSTTDALAVGSGVAGAVAGTLSQWAAKRRGRRTGGSKP